MKNILLPTDFSANSWNALEYAVQFFKNENCIFYILHIGDLKDSDIHSNSFAFTAEPPLITIKKKIKSFSTRVEQLLDNEKHHLIILYEYGNFIDIIRKTVYDKKIALIVMGTKGISGIKTAVVGSNTGNVITQVKNKEYLQDYLEEIFPYTPIFQSVSNKNIKEAILNFVGDNQIDMLTMVAKNLNFFQQLLFDTTIEKLSF